MTRKPKTGSQKSPVVDSDTEEGGHSIPAGSIRLCHQETCAGLERASHMYAKNRTHWTGLASTGCSHEEQSQVPEAENYAAWNNSALNNSFSNDAEFSLVVSLHMSSASCNWYWTKRYRGTDYFCYNTLSLRPNYQVQTMKITLGTAARN